MLSTSETACNLIFVYGTLRPGFENEREMKGARLLGAARTVESYTLMAYEELPFLARTPATCSIVGDIFEVSPQHIDHLDAF
ncbi:MAG: gamma-glutamylcyclotransferase [Candidatus Methylacidiphilales bacterium]